MRHDEKLNDLAAAEIAAIEADGIKLTAAEIVQLNALGWAIETPEGRRHLSRGVPVPVAGLWLWPLSLYASDWLERVGSDLSDRASLFATAYAMAFGRSDGNELNVTGREAEKAVLAWGRRLRCTPDELMEAVEQVMEQDAGHDLPQDPDGKPMAIGDFSAFLAATCGGDADFWERRCAQGYAFAVLNAAVKQNMADGKPTAQDPRIMAERAMGLASIKIRERAATNG